MSINTINDSEVELATLGLIAYRQGEYEKAINVFSELKSRDPELWECRLYLGMTYFKISRLSPAMQEFKDIVQWCPDPTLQKNALAALRAINKEAKDHPHGPKSGERRSP